MEKHPAVYILASRKNETLYVGVTSDLATRAWQHKNDIVEGFTKQYQVHLLIWYEALENMQSAIQREKRIKNWPRKWKLALIEDKNPTWRDPYETIVYRHPGLDPGSRTAYE
jgi:putative endonuclease